MVKHKSLETDGFTLVEVIIAAAIILITVVTLIGVHTLYLRVALSNSNVVKATYLAEEGLEALRFLRDSSWSENIETLSPGVNYGLVLNAGAWETSAGNFAIDDFERTVMLSNVYRDANGDIVSSGGTLDLDTKLVASSVSWADNGATTTKSISTYLTNLYEN